MSDCSWLPHRQLSWLMNAVVPTGSVRSNASNGSATPPCEVVRVNPPATSCCSMHACWAVTDAPVMAGAFLRPASATSIMLHVLHSGCTPPAISVATARLSCAAQAARRGEVAQSHICIYATRELLNTSDLIMIVHVPRPRKLPRPQKFPPNRLALVTASLVPIVQCPTHALVSGLCTRCKVTPITRVCARHVRSLLYCRHCTGKAHFAKR